MPRPKSKKPLEWQVKVHVLEARDLKGRESGGMSDPVCKIACFGKTQNTRIHKSTLSCVFDQLFYFSNKAFEEEMKNEKIRIAIYDANTVRRDVLIGAREFDLGTIYERDGHEYWKQWVALIYDEDYDKSEEDSPFKGIQGYLQLSIQVFGPGDEAIDHVDEEEEEGEAVDLQSLVLMPPDLETETWQLKLRVHRAEDLPALDFSFGKGSSDPYVLVKFGGKDPVKTHVKKKDLNPRWNEELRLPVTLPSMSDKIFVQLLDQDISSGDDVMATKYFSFKAIQEAGRTHPHWVNFYGAPLKAKESNELAAAMNEGRLEGTFYRGRVLLDLSAEKVDNAEMGIAAASDPIEPKNDTYILRFSLHEIVELPVDGNIAVEIFCGPTHERKAGIKSKKHRAKVYYDFQDMTLSYPKDLNQVPDIVIIVYVQRALVGKHKERIGYLRIPVSDVLGANHAPHWAALEPDQIDKVVGPETLPGYMLFSLDFINTTATAVPVRKPVQEPSTQEYELRCHLYQGRYIAAADDTGVSDPFAIVRVGDSEDHSEIVSETCFPQWYETIRFSVDLPKDLALAPDVQVIIFDHDKVGSPDFLGRFHVPLKDITPAFDTVPLWYRLHAEGDWGPAVGSSSKVNPAKTGDGDILCSFQLVPMFGGGAAKYPLPDIMPAMNDCFLELNVVGLRNLTSPDVMAVKGAYLEFDCGHRADGEYVSTGPAHKPNVYNPNHLESLKLPVKLPLNPLFAPSINVRCMDTRKFGDVLIGSGTIGTGDLLPWATGNDKKEKEKKEKEKKEKADKEKKDKEKEKEKADLDDTASIASSSSMRRRGKRDSKLPTRRLSVETELDVMEAKKAEEKEKGKEDEEEEEEDEEEEEEEEDDEDKPLLESGSKKEKKKKKKGKGKLKGEVAVDVPEKFEHGDQSMGIDPEAEAEEKALEGVKAELESILDDQPFGLYPLYRGKARGTKKEGGTRKQSGVFKGAVRVIMKKKDPPLYNLAQMYAPKDLKLRVYILRGIQLMAQDENGLSDPYMVLSVGKKKGEKIKDLEHVQKETLDPAFYQRYDFDISLPGNSALKIECWDWDALSSHDLIGATEIDLETRWFSKKWKDMNPKPVETRTLWSPSSSNPQGKLELFVEIMTPQEASAFPPKQIGPPEPKPFELRVVIWETKDVVLKDKNGSDVFVTGKIGDQKEQKTDVHWKCNDGKALFNWRMKFPLELPTDTPRFRMQLWDKDVGSANDSIGEANINLSSFFRSAYTRNSEKELDRQWVALTHPNFPGPQGSVQATFQILPEQTARDREAGLGRKEPNAWPHLTKPDRPDAPWAIGSKAGKWLKGKLLGHIYKKIALAVGGALLSWMIYAVATSHWPFGPKLFGEIQYQYNIK